DEEEVRRARQFPYQYLAAYLNADEKLPAKVRQALERAAEITCGNVPELPGPVVIGVDVSGSMASAVTGHPGVRGTSKVRCVDVAALFAAGVLPRTPGRVVIPFDTSAYEVDVPEGESILALATRRARHGGGGTNCSLPLHAANALKRLKNRAFAGCVLVSDSESWIGTGRGGQTATLTEWEGFVRNQKRVQGAAFSQPKLVCIDVQPYGTVQTPDREEILNVGGFSDAVFGVVAGFLTSDENRFVTEVEAIEL